MGILNIDDVPPPFGAGGGDGDRPAGVGDATGVGPSPSGQAAAAGASDAPAGAGVPGAPPAGGGFAVPPHVDGSAPPPQAPPTPPAPGQPPASSGFDAGAASTGAGAWGAADAAPPAESSAFDTSALTGPGPAGPAAPAGASASTPPPPIEPDPVRTLELEPRIVEQIATVFDPEIPVNIYELGLIYDVAVDKQGLAVIRMTLTAPGCPAAVTLPAEVQGKVKAIEGVADARVDVVWEPPWDKDRMSDAAKLQLGIFD